MPQAPYKFLGDKRASRGYSNNLLIESAGTSNQRREVRNLDRDIDLTLSSTGRRQLLQYGRWLFSNFPQVHGMVLEQANLAVSTFLPQYYGANKDWGNMAEAWLIEWHRIMDYRGWPYDYESWTQQLIIAGLRDGDMATLLVNGADDYPFIQPIPGHRIGSKAYEPTVAGGQYDGARIIDGVIVNDYGQPMAYRVWRDSPASSDMEFEDVPASNCVLTFWPKWGDQVRGIPELGAGIQWWLDAQETRQNELIAQRAASSIALMETNESGEQDTAKAVIKAAGTYDSAGGKATASVEKMDGGAIRYFRANAGCDLKAFSYDRPGSNAQAFLEVCLRDAFSAAEWDYYFSMDPTKVGGAPGRVIVERITRTLRKRRRMVEKACRRVDGWALSKAIKSGRLPEDLDWWKWDYQAPQDITADRKYDSDVDVQEINNRLRTQKDGCGRRGEYWEDVQDQWIAEQVRFQQKAKEAGLDLTKISVPTISGVKSFGGEAAKPTQPGQSEPVDEKPGDKEEEK